MFSLNPIPYIQNRELFTAHLKYIHAKICARFDLYSLIPNPFKTNTFSIEENNQFIYNTIIKAIDKKEGLMIGRFGAAEHDAIASTLLFQKKIIKQLNIPYTKLCSNAGFFPKTINTTLEISRYLKRFMDVYIQSSMSCDILGVWSGTLGFEKYFVDHFCKKNIKFTRMGAIGPNIHSSLPFTYALKDTTVLVIHPFAQTIQSQYAHKDQLFENKKVLPSFELKTLKAVQTSGDAIDTRFQDWFEALDWMSEEVLKTDFDIALLGCGAYGFPLAARIKNMGKIAIHFGGNLQLLFGIKGRRWEIEQPQVGKELFNPSWVYPNQEEKIEGSSKIEGGCYW